MSDENELNLTNEEIDFIFDCVRYCRGKTNSLTATESVKVLRLGDNVSIKLNHYLRLKGYYGSSEEDKIRMKIAEKCKPAIKDFIEQAVGHNCDGGDWDSSDDKASEEWTEDILKIIRGD